MNFSKCLSRSQRFTTFSMIWRIRSPCSPKSAYEKKICSIANFFLSKRETKCITEIIEQKISEKKFGQSCEIADGNSSTGPLYGFPQPISIVVFYTNLVPNFQWASNKFKRPTKKFTCMIFF